MVTRVYQTFPDTGTLYQTLPDTGTLYQTFPGTGTLPGVRIAVERDVNLLAPEFGIKILAHSVCKMRIKHEPKKVAL
jgi:hypothetical protein